MILDKTDLEMMDNCYRIIFYLRYVHTGLDQISCVSIDVNSFSVFHTEVNSDCLTHVSDFYLGSVKDNKEV